MIVAVTQINEMPVINGFYTRLEAFTVARFELVGCWILTCVSHNPEDHRLNDLLV
jgi:hypothetical protein